MAKQLLPFQHKKQSSIPFVGQAYTLNAPQLSCQTCVNMYPVLGLDKNIAKYPSAYFRTPGRESIHSITSQQSKIGRWIGSFNNRLFCVIGNGFYEYDPVFDELTTHGSLSSTSGMVKILFNGVMLHILDGVSSKLFDLETDTFSTLVEDDWEQAVTGTFQDGYGIYPVPNSSQFMVSELNDFGTFIPTTRGAISIAGEQLVGVQANSLDIWMFGQTKSEVWRNNGGNPNIPNSCPLERLQGSSIDRGCASAASICQVDNTIIWLSRTSQGVAEVVALDNFKPFVISTEALHQEWNRYDTVTDAEAYAYTYQGHTFYVITFLSANKTWSFDLMTQQWHRLADWDTSLGFIRSNISAFCYHTDNTPYALTCNSDKIYHLDGDIYDLDGEPLILERTFPTMTAGLTYITYYAFTLDLSKGIGLTSGQGENPQIMLQISRDGGYTWGNEMWLSMGKLGEYSKMIRWTKLGTNRDFTPRIRISDPVNVALFNATALVNYQFED